MEKKEPARKWVHGYMAAGTGIVVAAILPGTTGLALGVLELSMCYHIGRIYQGGEYSWDDARIATKVIGVTTMAAKAAAVVALELLNLAPGLGWLAKGPIAAGVMKGLGEATIAYYQSLETKLLN